MVKKIKNVLVIIIGLISGVIVHGAIEMLSIWFLLHRLQGLFFNFSWDTWYKIDLAFFAVVETITVVVIFRFYKKHEK